MGRSKARKSSKGVDRTSQKSDTPDAGREGKTEIRVYQEKPGDVPLIDFMDKLKLSDRMAILSVIEALGQLGHEMRPPHNEHLGDQLYYLRVRGEDGTYRVFYWPFGKGIVILGHGFSKKTDKCPPRELKRAQRMRERFAADPVRHTHKGAIDG